MQNDLQKQCLSSLFGNQMRKTSTGGMASDYLVADGRAWAGISRWRKLPQHFRFDSAVAMVVQNCARKKSVQRKILLGDQVWN
jgi:hypothetical protein